MDSTEFRAYARRKKSKKEEPSLFPQDRPVDCGDPKTSHRPADAVPADRLSSLEMEAAQALLELSRMPSPSSEQDRILRWSCKRKRTASAFRKDSACRPPRPNEGLEDALSAIKKNRSACPFGRDSSTSDRDEIESFRCSKYFSSTSENRAQSPSSPLPSLQCPSEALGAYADKAANSAFQRVHSVAPRLVTVKAEVDDTRPERPPLSHAQVSVQPKLKSCKCPMGLKASVEMEPSVDNNARCPEELRLNSAVTEIKGPGSGSFNEARCALTQEEKEARRLQRIQANRESARQTIRKKQVLCETLTKKASSLALENATMQQKRNLLLQELFWLKGQNHQLKEQVEKRSSGNLEHDTVALRLQNALDAIDRSSSEPPSSTYTSVPPPALFWAMAAAAAGAANQGHTFNKQETCEASSTLQQQNIAFLISNSALSIEQPPAPWSMQQNLSFAGSGDSFLTVLPQKERGLMVNKLASLHALKAQCDDSHNTTHAAAEYASRNLPREAACDMSMQPEGTPPQPTAGKPASNSLHSITATTKSIKFVQGLHVVKGSAAGCNFGSSVAELKGNLQEQGMKNYAAIIAAEARRRRKELTRNKFARARALKAAAVS